MQRAASLLRTPSYLRILRVQSIGPAYVPRGLACNLTLTVSNGNPVKILAAPATPPLRALVVLSGLPNPIASDLFTAVPSLRVGSLATGLEAESMQTTRVGAVNARLSELKSDQLASIA